MNIAFLGAGKMATAIAKGLVFRGIIPASAMSAADISAEVCRIFTENTGVDCLTDPEAALAPADAVVLAVKPQQAQQAIKPVAGLCGDKLVISIAAGLTLARLSEWFGHRRIIRVMPNTPATVGFGAAVYSCDTQVSPADRTLVERMFSAVGIVIAMPEDRQDAATALSGSGPAYMFEMIRALVSGAEALGLEAGDALQLAVQTMAGAAEMLRQGIGTPEQLRKDVTSPGGTTAAGLAVLADADFEGLMAEVLTAARDRSLELGAG